MSRYFHIILSVIAIAMGFTACKGDWYDNSPNEPLKLSLTKIKEAKHATQINVSVTSRDGTWSVSGMTDWCTVSPEEGGKGVSKIIVSLTANTAEGAVDRTMTLTFTPGNEESAAKTIDVTQLISDEVPPRNQDEDYELNSRIHDSIIKKWYYWSRDVENANVDYNQSYSNFYTRFLGNLSGDPLIYDGNTWTTGARRYLYSSIKRHPVGTAARNLPLLNYGMEFDIIKHSSFPEPVARILYVLPGSPAAKAGLKRGDWFRKVSDINGKFINLGGWQITGSEPPRYQYEDRIDSLVHPVEGFSPRLEILRYFPTEGLQGTLREGSRTVTLTPERFNATRFTGNPILYSNSANTGYPDRRPNNLIIVEEGTRTGYLVLLSLDSAWESELRQEFINFKNLAAPLTHFILDLRYCKSGSVEMAEMIGNRLVPQTANGKTFARYEFNTNHSANNRTALFSANSVESLEVPIIFILTSKHTAGAAELLINALNGIDDVKLVVIGDATEGMNVGTVRHPGYRNSVSPDWEYDIRIVAFRCYNSADFGDYQYGFVPNGGTVDEFNKSTWLKVPNTEWMEFWSWRGGKSGGMEDPLLAKAMNYVRGIEQIPTGKVQASTTRTRSGFPRDFCFPTNMTMDNVVITE